MLTETLRAASANWTTVAKVSSSVTMRTSLATLPMLPAATRSVLRNVIWCSIGCPPSTTHATSSPCPGTHPPPPASSPSIVVRIAFRNVAGASGFTTTWITLATCAPPGWATGGCAGWPGVHSLFTVPSPADAQFTSSAVVSPAYDSTFFGAFGDAFAPPGRFRFGPASLSAAAGGRGVRHVSVGLGDAVSRLPAASPWWHRQAMRSGGPVEGRRGVDHKSARAAPSTEQPPLTTRCPRSTAAAHRSRGAGSAAPFCVAQNERFAASSAPPPPSPRLAACGPRDADGFSFEARGLPSACRRSRCLRRLAAGAGSASLFTQRRHTRVSSAAAGNDAW
ncbi:hypothetical protein DIPPA_13445 [Diplonema papillatum]|nr:hypothetical protein DIPPA_13445 [Diplonema papillatum]